MEGHSYPLGSMEHSADENHTSIPESPDDHAQQDSSTFFDDAMQMLPNDENHNILMDEPHSPLYPLDHSEKTFEAVDADPLFQYIDWGNHFDVPTCDLENSSYSSVCQPFTRTPSLSSLASFGSMDSGVSTPAGTQKKRKRVTNTTNSQLVDKPTAEHATKKACHETDISTECVNPGNEIQQTTQAPSETAPVVSEQQIQNRTVSLACPWYKRFPLHHGDCSGHKLLQIKDVMQHIRCKHLRSHEMPSPPCEEPPFPGELCNDDTKSQICEPGGAEKTSKVNGIYMETFGLLVYDHVKPMEESWYDFWDIIFEGTPRPASPFLGTSIEESVRVAEAYWKQEADDTVAMILHDQQQVEAGQLSNFVTKLFCELRSRASKLEDTSHEKLEISLEGETN